MKKEIENGAYNVACVTIKIHKTGNHNIDVELKRFYNATRNLLRELRDDYRNYLKGMMGMISATSGRENEPIYDHTVDAGIKYNCKTSQNESVIECFMNGDALHEMGASYDSIKLTKEEAKRFGITPGVMLEESEELMAYIAEKRINDFFKLIGTPIKVKNGNKTEIAYTWNEEKYGCKSDMKGFGEQVDNVLSKRKIIQYLKKLDIFEEADSIYESGVTFENVLISAVDAFSEKHKTESIEVEAGIFINGDSNIVANQIDVYSNKEYVVKKDYLLSEPDEKWTIGWKEISILPYKLIDEEANVTVDTNHTEMVITFNAPQVPVGIILKGIDKICKIYKSNIELAEKSGLSADDLPIEYRPHSYIDYKMTEIQHLMLLSKNFKLAEIPITDAGSDADIHIIEFSD